VEKDARRVQIPPTAAEADEDVDPVQEGDRYFRKLALRRDGAESSNRRDRPRQFYALLVNEATEAVVGIGPELAVNDRFMTKTLAGVVPVYPIDRNGRHRVWRYGRSTMARLVHASEIRARWNEQLGIWSLLHLKPISKEEAERRKPRTVWWHPTHDAGAHGSTLLNKILGERSLFPFPKSVYAVLDCLRLVVESRPKALVLDFFAGSGTTLHALALMNASDGGNRRCILVTNNEVDEATAQRLNGAGVYRGDEEFERHGIFQQVTRPRSEAIITGRRPDGSALPDNYVDGRPLANGFDENVEFFETQYLDPQDVDLGRQFDAILPALWLAAGGVGDREQDASSKHFSMPPSSTYAVLFRESSLAPVR
jgi:adenine-specific DNA-methyltransferase